MTNNVSAPSASSIDVGGDRHDELFRVLADPRRRFVLRSLLLADREMSVSELSSDIVAWETDMTDTENVGGQRGTVEISLLHTHLPKMDRAGLISYHEDAETVVLISCDDELDHHLGPVESLATGDD